MKTHVGPVVAAGIVFAGCMLAPGWAASTSPGYNVLLLMTDEHQARVMGCAGDPIVKTPTLDSLAATGVRFTAAYCQNPVCTPSRVALVSGRMPSNLGTFGNGNTQKYENVTTMADLFVKAGYQAVWFGKTHWGDPRFVNSRGVQRADFEETEKAIGRLPQESAVAKSPVEQNTDHITTNEALAFLDESKGRKFFLGVSDQASLPVHDPAEVLRPLQGQGRPAPRYRQIDFRTSVAGKRGTREI